MSSSNSKISDIRFTDISSTVFGWANRNSVYEQTILLVNALALGDTLQEIPNVLNFVANQIEQLESWCTASREAEALLDLAHASRHDSSVQAVKSPDLIEKKAESRLHGELGNLYMLAMLTSQIPSQNSNEREWHQKFKLWILLQALKCWNEDHIHDNHIKIVCDRTRLASYKTDQVFTLITGLQTGTEDLPVLSFMIEFNAMTMMNHAPGRSEHQFLLALTKVADGERSQIRNTNFPPPITPVKTEIAFLKEPSAYSRAWPRDEEEDKDEEEALTLIPGDDDAPDILTVTAKEMTFGLRELKASSVLLQSTENLQLLPWSWDVPNPSERRILDRKIEALLESSSRQDQFIGCVAWIAINAGLSFRRSLEISVMAEPTPAWSLSADALTLHRSPPRHAKSWKPRGRQAAEWLIPALEENNLALPNRFSSLKNIPGFYAGKKLWELWAELWPTQSPLDRFRELLSHELPRLTPAMLRNILPRQVYERSGDDKLSRALPSHASSGLPAACAYYSWRTSQDIVSSQVPAKSSNDEGDPIAFGSLLYPVESMLQKSIEIATQKVRSIASSGDMIDFHNALVAYIHCMLLAATGVRPIRDAFESPEQFDHEHHFVYIDDKTDSKGQRGRLIPLPPNLSAYLQVTYRRHLKLVANFLNAGAPSVAKEVLLLSVGIASSKMPYFFFLSREESCGWRSVSNRAIQDTELFNWPLPSNLFRQRLAKLLPRSGVHSEVIDGILGHYESGCEPYGDFSPRIWIKDVFHARTAMQKAFDRLGFEFLSDSPVGMQTETLVIGDDARPAIFGMAARDLNRKERKRNILRCARNDIKQYLNGRKLESLDADELNLLVKKMLFENGIPRSDGLYRAHYLQRLARQQSRGNASNIKLNRLFLAPTPRSPFSPVSPRALQCMEASRAVLNSILTALANQNIEAVEASFAAAVLLMLENRVSDIFLFEKISGGRNYRLVALQGIKYVEIGLGELDDFDPLAQVRRFKISESCAHFLLKARHQLPDGRSWNEQIPHRFKELPSACGLHAVHNRIPQSTLIGHLASMIDQANVIELPGIVAGYLAGRLESTSLGWMDLMRLATGHPARIPDSWASKHDSVPRQEDNLLQIEGAPSRPDPDFLESTLAQNSKRLFSQVRILLRDFADAEGFSLNRRRDQQAEFNRRLAAYKGQVSSTCYLLGMWVSHLLLRKRSAKMFLRISTVLRYFESLASKFAEVAHEAEILAMDGEEVTALYAEILALARPSDRAYTAERLTDFHSWTRKAGVEEPDWNEIGIDSNVYGVRPGVITENEYQSALHLLYHSKAVSRDQRNSAAMLLLLAYRFGLRGGEVLGLQMSDWVEMDGVITVIIRDNRLRKLKTSSSRRQVPLLFRLTKFEQELLGNAFDSHYSIFGDVKDAPLLHERGTVPDHHQRAQLKSLVIDALRQATGNPDTTLHHARHTVINRIGHHLFGLRLPQWKGRQLALPEGAAELLLGSNTSGRRVVWAMARFLGHATRDTQFRSYLHLLDGWADTYQRPLSSGMEALSNEGIILLDDFPAVTRASTILLEATNPKPMRATLQGMVRLLRLIGNGKNPESAALSLNIDPELAKTASELLSLISSRLREVNRLPDSMRSLLGKISQTGWARLSQLAEQQQGQFDDQTGENHLNIDAKKKLAQVVSLNGQIVMWENWHLEVIRNFLEVMGIRAEVYSCIKSNHASQDLVEAAKFIGFAPLSQEEAKKRSGEVQIDGIKVPGADHRVANRIALLFHRNMKLSVRNRRELLVMLVVYLSLI